MATRRVFRSEHGALWWECKPGLWTQAAHWETACRRSRSELSRSLANLTFIELKQNRTLTDVTAEHPEIHTEVA
jgi:hypothetical protein